MIDGLSGPQSLTRHGEDDDEDIIDDGSVSSSMMDESSYFGGGNNSIKFTNKSIKKSDMRMDESGQGDSESASNFKQDISN